MLKKMLLLCGLIACLGRGGLNAQQTISVAGGEALNRFGSVSYTIGQVFYQYAKSTAGSVNPSVQETSKAGTVSVENVSEAHITALVYPNPSAASITLRIEDKYLEHLIYRLYDCNGKLIKSQYINTTETPIHLENLQAGTYLLKIGGNKNNLQTFKIIKNQ
jgi:hypothetical protein